MAKSATINVRIEPEVKANVEKLFSSFGITVSDAINIFLYKSLMEGGLPFEVKQPRFNAETEEAIQEARDIMSGKIKAKKYDSIDDAFKDLGINA
ncbi:type II toxin-antitoxin system RelB/DinJ family antitoxin [Megamonas sp.]